MGVSDQKLNVIDEQGNIVGEATREEVHREGLLHREVHVWFYVPNGGVILQRRAKDKDTFPNCLDATVGGHVEIGDDFVTAALKETEEETGVRLRSEELTLVRYYRSYAEDLVTGMKNNRVAAQYIYRYDGDVKNLRVEAKKAQGFEVWPVERLLQHDPKDADLLIPSIHGGKMDFLLQRIQKLCKS